MLISVPWARGAVAGLAGGLAWLAGIVIFFGPAQALLTDPDLQSAKFIEAFSSEPAPRANEAPWVLLAGLLAIGAIWGEIYVWLSSTWQGVWWRRGLRFGVVGWVLMVPWFEFYLPWNVMREPAPLVVLEMACWAGVLLGVGLAIAGVDALLKRESRTTVI